MTLDFSSEDIANKCDEYQIDDASLYSAFIGGNGNDTFFSSSQFKVSASGGDDNDTFNYFIGDADMHIEFGNNSDRLNIYTSFFEKTEQNIVLKYDSSSKNLSIKHNEDSVGELYLSDFTQEDTIFIDNIELNLGLFDNQNEISWTTLASKNSQTTNKITSENISLETLLNQTFSDPLTLSQANLSVI